MKGWSPYASVLYEWRFSSGSGQRFSYHKFHAVCRRILFPVPRPLLESSSITFQPSRGAVFFLFDHSVFTEKLTTLSFFLLADVSWFLFVALFHERYIASLSTLLFITTPFIASYSRVVLSQLPALSLIILTSYLLFRFLETKKNDAMAFAIGFILSLYAKQLAILMVPVFILSIFGDYVDSKFRS